jgi:hypothetical protein
MPYQLFILALITSLKIVFVYACYQEGMFLFPLRRLMDKVISYLPAKVYLWIRKPLFYCLTCMSSVYGILFTYKLASFTWEYLQFLFIIGGFNYLFGCFITIMAPEEKIEQEPEWEKGNQVFSNIIHRFDKQ